MDNVTFTASPAERKAAIRAELEQRARACETISYGEMAGLAGLIPLGMESYLDAIEAEEAELGRPDLGCLVVNAVTGFPGSVGHGEAERTDALLTREAVFRAWAS